MKSKDALLIFTRNPELGKCKTRLAVKVGDSIALEIYTFLLEHTNKITKGLSANKLVYYSDEIWEDDLWNNQDFEKKIQEGEDLGARMSHAFGKAFQKGHHKVIIIGSDMYDLDQKDIENAFAALDDHNYVIGPAQDGGYYLLGMDTKNLDVFKKKEWGKETVLEDTLADLKDRSIKFLKTKNDVDLYEDIKDVAAFWPFLKNI